MPTAAARQVVEVSEGAVPAERRALVAGFLPLFAADLGLPPEVTVRWFRPESELAKSMRLAGRGVRARSPIPDADTGLAGFVNPKAHNTLWLRADAEPDALVETLAHEARHSQHVGRVLAGQDRDRDDEPEADAYGKEVAAAWKRGGFEGVFTMLMSQKSASAPALSHKTLPFRITSLKAAGSGWHVEGYASTFMGEPDVYGDVIAPGAFAASIATRKTKLLYEHHEPIGYQIALSEDSRGLFGKWGIVDTTQGRDAHTLALAGVLDGLSIGYFATDFEMRSDGVRVLKAIDLFEVSLVAIPANQNALVTGVKHGTGRPGGERVNLGYEIRKRRYAAFKRRMAARGVAV